MGSELLDAILDALGSRVVQRKANGEIVAWCPFHPDGQGNPPHHPNLVIKPGSKGAAYVWACPVCNVGGNLLDLADRLREIGVMPARDGRKPSGKAIAAYDYRDEEGRLIHQVLRFSNKRFAQRRPDGKGGWLWNLGGIRRTLYRLPELLAADAEQWVFVVEGEKDADNLARLGLVATTNSEGAGKWRDELSPHVKGRKVAILPDNDDPGRRHARDVAAKIAPYAADVRIVVLPGLPPGSDVSDWLTQGHTAEELAALVEAAPSWEGATGPPDLPALLDDVRAFIRRYVVLSDAQTDVVALWTAHTWALDAAETTPYLSITSAEKRSGKTRLLEVLQLVAARPWFTGRVTAAVLVRKSGQMPSLLLDESDAAFRGEKEYAETLRAVLNAGYRRGGVASLCVKAGADFELRDFPVYCPKAIAGIGKLPDTVADRAIPIVLKRRAPNEPVGRLRWREAREESEPIREVLEPWAVANVGALQEARPDIPPELDDRAADSWEPLFAIADAAEGEWPERARKAALALSVGDGRDDDSLGVLLLHDIRAIFEERSVDRIASGELVKALVAMEEAPWGDLEGKSLVARTLARQLRPYGVRSHQVRFGEKTLKGYERSDFEDAWERYVPTPGLSETRETSETKGRPRLNLDEENVSDVSDVSVNSEVLAPPTDAAAHAPCDDAIPPGLTGKRHYLIALGVELGFPRIIFGDKEGIPAGRFYYEQAARYFKDEDIEKGVAAVEALVAH